MVHNFLDTKFGKRTSFIVVPLYIGIGILAGLGFSTSNYLDENNGSSIVVATVHNYSDLLESNSDYVNLAAIPSKVIRHPFLNVFVVYGSAVEDGVFYFFKDLKPEEDNRGLYSRISFGPNNFNWNKKRKLTRDYVAALDEMYELMVDSTNYQSRLVLTKNMKNQKG